MNKRGHWIHLIFPDDEHTDFEKVWGRDITLPGYEEYDLFISRSTKDYGIAVTEGKSGFALAKGKDTKEAIKEAKEILDRNGKVAFNKVIANAIKKYGITPRYLSVTK